MSDNKVQNSSVNGGKIVVSIEGNIGAGKTTILKQLQHKYSTNKDIVFIREPVDLWEDFTDSNGVNVLKKFYEDPKKYAFAFQIMAFTTRARLLRQSLLDNPHAKIFFCERSLESDKEIFAKMLHDDGMMDEIMFKIYNSSFQEYLKESDKVRLGHIFYLEVPPEECAKRIKKRARDGEDNIDHNYLQRCHNYHNEWLFNTKTPVTVLNGPFDENISQIDQCLTINLFTE